MGKQAVHNYHAYLLRLWREDDATPWRASLENPHTGERIHFANDKQLYAFLHEQMVAHSGPIGHENVDTDSE